MTTISDPSAMTPEDQRWLSWFMQQRRFDRLSRKAQTGASLITDFAAGVYEMGYPGQRRGSYELSDLVKYDRSTGGGIINQIGQFEWVSSGVARLTYDPVTLQPLGLLIEEQRTNLLMRSTLEGGTAGTIGSGAVAPTGWSFAAPTPSGDVSYQVTNFCTIGVRFQAVAQRPTIRQTFAAAANLPYCLSGRITALTGSLVIQDVVQYANLPAGATTKWLKNGVAVAGTSPVASGDFVTAVLTVAATAGNADARFGPGGSSNVTCDCTMTMPQLEQASAPSTYIPTTTAQVTRAADMCRVNTLSPWYNPLEGTLVVSAIADAPSPFRLNVASIDDGTAANRIQVRHTGATAGSALAVSGGTIQAGELVSSAGSWPTGTPGKAAFSYKENSFAFSVGGGGVVFDNSGSVPPVTRLVIGGASAGASALNGTISRITYYPRVIDVQQASA